MKHDHLCFLIGPMQNAAQRERQQRLAKEILAPLLDSHGYEIVTPDQPTVGQIVHQVIAKLDSADLVVADLTNNNPSVMYELAIRHCIGLPYIVVVHKSLEAADTDSVAFDVRHYRYCAIDMDNPTSARADLGSVVETTITEIAEGKLQANPVTEYYNKRPLVESSPGAGLALGYFLNFVRRTALAILDANARVEISATQRPAANEPKSVLDREQLDDLKMAIYLPGNLEEASPDYVDETVRDLAKSGFVMSYADIAAPGRRVGVRAHRNVLIDIPTTMSAMREAIRPRGSETELRLDSAEGQYLLRREFERFNAALDRWIHGGEDPDPRVRAFMRVRVSVQNLCDLGMLAGVK